MHKFWFYSKIYYMPVHVSSTTVLIIRRSKLYYTTSGISQPVHRTATYTRDDTRCCILQFWPPDDEHMVLETCRGI